MNVSTSTQNRSKTIYLLYSGPHKPQMVKLKGWLEKNLSQYTYRLTSQFLLAHKIKKNAPSAVIAYNKNLYSPKNAGALISYCNQGGKLLVLHHNISSMMLRRPEWLEFAQVSIVKGDAAAHPWAVIEGDDLFLTNLAPDHPITTTHVEYPTEAPSFEIFPSINLDPKKEINTLHLTPEMTKKAEDGNKIPAFKLETTEFFINHDLLPTPDRTLLFGQYYKDLKTGKAFLAPNGGWTLPREKGMLIYLMPGHQPADYTENFCQIIKNCLEFEK